jgi:hypothetical protein
VCHLIVSDAPGSYKYELATFGFQQSRSAIIHRTIRCATGLSGAPVKQQLPVQRSTAMDTCKVLQCADSSRRSQSSRQRRTGQCTVPVRCGTRLYGATRIKSSNGRNHRNRNGWVTWLAHRTVRCAHRQQPPPTVVLVVEGYKYPPTTTTPTIKAFITLNSIKEQNTTLQDTNQSLRSDQSPQFNSSL